MALGCGREVGEGDRVRAAMRRQAVGGWEPWTGRCSSLHIC